MKKSDLGIVIVHWLMATSLIGVSITGLLYLYKEYRPCTAWLFEPDKIGLIHIWLSVAVVVFMVSYIIYLKQSNLFSRIQLHLRGMVIKGQVRWKYVTNLFYWLLFFVILLETFSGILLTKLINLDTLQQIFYIQKSYLVSVHYYLVWFILAFPVVHVMLHWLDGGYRKVSCMFKPQIFPRRPTLVDIVVVMKEENKKLKEKVKKYESASRRSNTTAQSQCSGTGTEPIC